MKLLVRGDDFGFTKAVTYGIVDAIDNGVLRNTGLFTNMPSSALAASMMDGRDEVCFGIDFNIVAGKPVSDPKDVPHLVDENGEFIRSGRRVSDPRYQSEEGQNELFPYDEVYRELKAQYDRFLELRHGVKPGYLHPHSIMPANYIRAIRQLSQETEIPYSMDIQKKYGFVSVFTFKKQDFSKAMNTKVFDPMAQLNKNPLKDVQDYSDQLLASPYVEIGGHPGFVDADLLDNTTLSLERVRDHAMMTSDWIKNWVRDNSIELITYRDL